MAKTGRLPLDPECVKSERIFLSLTKKQTETLLEKTGHTNRTKALRVAALDYIENK